VRTLEAELAALQAAAAQGGQMLADKKAEILALTNTLPASDAENAQLSHNLQQARAEIDRLRVELAKTMGAYEDALAKLRQEMALALLHAQLPGFLLQAQINQRLQRVAALERDKTALETEVNAAKEEALRQLREKEGVAEAATRDRVEAIRARDQAVTSCS
jgi:chromosome segregation ATPase